MKYLLLISALASQIVAAPIYAGEAWQTVAKANGSWLWFDLYNAELQVHQKINPKEILDDKVPLKLKLCYQRDIEKDWLIEAAEKHLPSNTSEALNQEVSKLHQNYQSVAKGDCYALEHNAEGITTLNLNNKPIFQSELPNFKALYFGLWLGEHAISSDVKASLLESL